MSHRAPGSPGLSSEHFLAGKPIRYYRPKGSQEVRQLVEEGFQAFGRVATTRAAAEGIGAFLAGRKPDFTGM